MLLISPLTFGNKANKICMDYILAASEKAPDEIVTAVLPAFSTDKPSSCQS